MIDVIVALDQKAVILGIEDRALGVGTGERLDGVPAVPQRHKKKLALAVPLTAERDHALVTRRRLVLVNPGLVEILDVGIAIARLRRPTPGARDHEQPSYRNVPGLTS